MSHLAVDKNGRFYQTSRDRADGLGYECHPETVDVGDVTLGSSYLKAQRAQQGRVIKERQTLAAQDLQDKQTAMAQRAAMGVARRKAASEQALMGNESVKRNMIRKAMMQGYQTGCTSQMSGNPLTANGQMGWNGMSVDQRAIHNRITGMGADLSYKITASEAKQKQHEAQAARVIGAQAQRSEQMRVSASQKQAVNNEVRRQQSMGWDTNASKSITRSAPRIQQPTVSLSQAVHPMMARR